MYRKQRIFFFFFLLLIVSLCIHLYQGTPQKSLYRFENKLAELKDHYIEFNRICCRYGEECFKESGRSHNSLSLPESSFEKTQLEEHTLQFVLNKKVWIGELLAALFQPTLLSANHDLTLLL